MLIAQWIWEITDILVIKIVSFWKKVWLKKNCFAPAPQSQNRSYGIAAITICLVFFINNDVVEIISKYILYRYLFCFDVMPTHSKYWVVTKVLKRIAITYPPAICEMNTLRLSRLIIRIFVNVIGFITNLETELTMFDHSKKYQAMILIIKDI